MRLERQLALLATVFTLAIDPAVLRAEVSCSGGTTQCAPIVMAPLGADESLVWHPYRSIDLVNLLNAAGEARGDRHVRVVVNPATRRPEAVWSFWDGSDFEIAWSRFEPGGWSSAFLITDNTTNDDLADLAFSSDGSRGIAWRSCVTGCVVKYREDDPVAGWSPEIPVAGSLNVDAGPRIVFHGLAAHVAFSRSIEPGLSEIVVSQGVDDSVPWPTLFDPELIAITPWLGTTSPELIAYPDHFFTMWTQSSTQVGFSRFTNGVWQAPEFEPYSNAPGDEFRARARIKGRIVRGN